MSVLLLGHAYSLPTIFLCVVFLRSTVRSFEGSIAAMTRKEKKKLSEDALSLSRHVDLD